jgi:hypothetical protein
MSFLEASEDYDLAPIGIGSMHKQAQKLAEFGRHGDIYFIHAAKGETVIPLEVLNANPKVKDMLFDQMREMGLDPEEFVVGNELNSINPVTGMPEFFFSSLWRSVKRIAKKIAPVVLPLAAAAFGIPFLGPAFGAGTFGASFLASGIGTLASGGNLKDAFKSGLVSGGLTSLVSGLGGAFSKSGTFLGGLEGSFTGATPVFDAAGAQIGTRMAASPGAESGLNLTGASPEALARAQAQSTTQWDRILGRGTERDIFGGVTQGSVFDPATGEGPGFVPVTPPPPVALPAAPSAQTVLGGADNLSLQAYPSYSELGGATALPHVPAAPVTSGRPLTTLEKVQQWTPFAEPRYEVSSGKFLTDQAAKNAARKAAIASTTEAIGPELAGSEAGAAMILAAGNKAAAATVPGAAQRYGLTVLGGIGAAKAFKLFDAPEIDQPTEGDLAGFTSGLTGAELVEGDPDRYLLPEEALDPLRYNVGRALVPTTYSAQGGLAEYPPRDLLVEGPGTERSDEIPAMLSDGEFVMNAKSVRGADPSGGGNRYAGANNLYKMMRNFEMRS